MDLGLGCRKRRLERMRFAHRFGRLDFAGRVVHIQVQYDGELHGQEGCRHPLRDGPDQPGAGRPLDHRECA